MKTYTFILIITVFCFICSCSSKKTADKSTEHTATLSLTATPIVMTPKVAETDTNKVYITAEQMPIFPGGEKEMHRFIYENLKYPEIPEDKLMENLSTTVRFVVSRTGDIKDIEATRPQYKGTILTDSLTQIIKRMPKWTPGKQNGINVNVYISIPLHVSPKR